MLVVASLVSLAPTAASGATGCPDTVFLGDHPNEELGWTDNVQGVAHDAGHWFFTTQSDPYLLKLPVDFDLATELDPDDSDTWPAGALVIEMPAQLETAGYEKFKDLDQAMGYLFVPVVGSDPETDDGITAIAVFRASDLGLVGFKPLTEISHASFAAFNMQDHLLYVSTTSVGWDGSQSQPLYRYSVDFGALNANDAAGAVQFDSTFDLTEGAGPVNPRLDNMQGGTFTPWGDLYLVNGLSDPPSSDRGGVHLFDPTGSLAAESTNGTGFFNYQYDPSEWPEGEEPEGADWWNRDTGTPSPGIGGQLHVIMLDNDVFEDDLYLKHYAVDYSCIASGDVDGDGLSNGDEIYTIGTDPKHADTDGDGLSDGLEVNKLGTNPLAKDSDGNGTPDGQEDHDGDGLTNADEVTLYGTDPVLSDTDTDGLSDGTEVNLSHTNPLNADTDGDGLTDGEEVNVWRTDPLVADTDHDGLTDGQEVNVCATDPLDADTDDDLLPDGLEVAYDTNPLTADTDNDGLIDGKDVEFIQNAVTAVPGSSFKPPGGGTRNAILSILADTETLLRAPDPDNAVRKLENLRRHIDGCGDAPDVNDWILSCQYQTPIRSLVDLLITNVELVN